MCHNETKSGKKEGKDVYKIYRSLGRRKKIYDCRLTGHNTLSDMDSVKA